ncbi:MAG: TIGR00341 family protein [Candidatus Kariarchaeaceae archaeon]|jgi:uncharacterized hydrophobic protein (TIGR00341 family)
MKQVQVVVPKNQVEVIEDLLTDFNMGNRSIQIESVNGQVMFQITVESDESNNLLHELKARGVGAVFGTITMLPISLHLSGTSHTTSIPKTAAANLEEILAEIESSATLSSTYIALVLLSGLLAAFGLIGDSVVIIIGSMIVAPLLGPVALTSIGVLLRGRGLLQKGLAAESVGIILTIGVGFLVGIAAGFPEETSEMVSRAEGADPINVVFAIVAAIAAGMIISRGQGLSIVGVAIAASLAPPAANIGLYAALALEDPAKWSGARISAILLLINILAINASCSIIFQLYRLPERAGISKRRATRAQRISYVTTVIILILFIALSLFLLDDAL